MSSLRRAWTAFWSRPGAERRRLLRRAFGRVRTDGVLATLAWIRAGGATATDAVRYDAWVRQHSPAADELFEMRDAAARFRYRPLISILTATYNTDPAWLNAAAESVLRQAYTDWEWHVADDGSTSPTTTATLARLSARDSRIHVHRAGVNGGISAASNLALAHASGEYIALMDHDDALVPHALFRVAECLNASDPPPDVVYSDEDKLDAHGRRCDPYFKPDWSPDLFRSSMYACHLLVIRKALVEQVGGFHGSFDYSQDYDLLLRVIEQTEQVNHIPDVLYHWRKTPASTALAGEAKPTAHRAGARALQAHLDRLGIGGEIVDAGPPGLYRVRYALTSNPLVSVIVPTRNPDGAVITETLSALAANTRYSAYEVVLVSEERAAPQSSARGMRLRRVTPSGGFNLAEWMNQGSRAAGGAHLVFMHDDVSPLDPDWLGAMLELSTQPWVGAVGAKLLAPDGSLRHIGLVLGLDGLAGSPFRGFPGATVGYYSGANCIRNYSAVSSACLMTRRDVFEQVGGFDRRLSGVGIDVDYGLRVTASGRRVVFTPYARLLHRESSGLTRSALSIDERDHLQHRWGTRLERDPFYNPHLDTRRGDYQLRGDE